MQKLSFSRLDNLFGKIPFVYRYWLSVLVISCLPVIFLILFTTRQANLVDFKFVSNDEVSYFHQIMTFKEVGFNGGYYTLFEEIPNATFTHFYTYGPWFPLVYGFIARFTGWELYSFLILNSLVVVVSIFGFCYVTRPNVWQLILVGIGLMTTYSFMLFLFTGFQEAFQQALAIGMAAIFAIAFQYRERTLFKYRVIGTLFIVGAGLTRISWCLLLFPYLILVSKIQIKAIILCLVIAVGLSYGVYWIWGQVGAPGNNMITIALSGFSYSLRRGGTMLLDRISQNIQWILNPQDEYAPPEKILYLLQNIQVIFIVAISLIAAGLTWYRFRKFAMIFDWLFHSYNLATIVGLTLALYVTRYRGDYRVIAPHLMLTVFILIYMKRYRIVLLLIGTSLLFLPQYLESQSLSSIAHFDPVTHQAYEDFRQVAYSTIQYDPSAPNAWCNTLFFHVNNYVTEIAGTPGGIGLSFYFSGNLKNSYLRSKYLLLDDQDYLSIQQRFSPPHLIALGVTRLGTLYQNMDSACYTPKS